MEDSLKRTGMLFFLNPMRDPRNTILKLQSCMVLFSSVHYSKQACFHPTSGVSLCLAKTVRRDRADRAQGRIRPENVHS